MSLRKFRCSAVYGANDLCYERSVESFDHESASEVYVETHLADLDYPEEVRVHVQEDGSGHSKRFNVIVQSVPEATARLIPDQEDV